jgi:hypothetical protein
MKVFKLKKIKEPGFKTLIITENFSENIMRIANELKQPFQKEKNFFMLAAAILIIALMVPILYSNANTELDSATLENYLSYQTNLSQYDLINSLEFEDKQYKYDGCP